MWFIPGVCRPLPSQEAVGATESSAAEESASDASYSADDQPEERSAAATCPPGPMPSSGFAPPALVL